MLLVLFRLLLLFLVCVSPKSCDRHSLRIHMSPQRSVPYENNDNISISFQYLANVLSALWVKSVSKSITNTNSNNNKDNNKHNNNNDNDNNNNVMTIIITPATPAAAAAAAATAAAAAANYKQTNNDSSKPSLRMVTFPKTWANLLRTWHATSSAATATDCCGGGCCWCCSNGSSLL